MSGWVIECECGHTAGVHRRTDDSPVVCLDADCPCGVWSPDTLAWVP